MNMNTDIKWNKSCITITEAQEKKLQKFRSVIEPSESPELAIFKRWIDELTVWDVRILRLFDNPDAWFKAQKPEKSVPKSSDRVGLVLYAFREYDSFQERDDLTKPIITCIIDDLERSGLIQKRIRRLTNLGSKFIDFIFNAEM